MFEKTRCQPINRKPWFCVCACVRFLQCQRKWKWNGKRVARWTPDVRQGGVYPAGKRDSILPSGGVHSQSEAPSWVCPAPQMLPQRMLSNGFRQRLHALNKKFQNSIHQTSNFRQTLGCVFPLLELPLFVILTIFDSSAMKQNNSTSCDSLFTTIFQNIHIYYYDQLKEKRNYFTYHM